MIVNLKTFIVAAKPLSRSSRRAQLDIRALNKTCGEFLDDADDDEDAAAATPRLSTANATAVGANADDCSFVNNSGSEMSASTIDDLTRLYKPPQQRTYTLADFIRARRRDGAVLVRPKTTRAQAIAIDDYVQVR